MREAQQTARGRMNENLEEQFKDLFQKFLAQEGELRRQVLLLESVAAKNNLYFIVFDGGEHIIYHNLPNRKAFTFLSDMEYILQKDIIDQIRKYIAADPPKTFERTLKNTALEINFFAHDKWENFFFLQIALFNHRRNARPVRDEREYSQAENGFNDLHSVLKLLEEIKNIESIEQKKKLFRKIQDHYLPTLEQLRYGINDPIISMCFEIIHKNLEEVVDPSGSMSSLYKILTPSEIKVAEFIRMGKSSQDIAEALDIAQKTVENHRNSLRNKLGLKNKGINLRSYLLNLDRDIL
jgi:DNA-binding CsgD family transcriptional regulator